MILITNRLFRTEIKFIDYTDPWKLFKDYAGLFERFKLWVAKTLGVRILLVHAEVMR